MTSVSRVLITLLLAAPGVASAQQAAQAEVKAAARSADSVRVGCSGGNTGQGSGNTLTRSGQLAQYVKPLREPATHTPLLRDSAAAAKVFAALERIRFRTLRFNRVDNMTCVLELNDSGGRHAVTWSKGLPPAELAPVLAALARAFGEDRRSWP